jgi:hypothetical protein
MRGEVTNLIDQGVLPSSSSNIQVIERWQEAIHAIHAPVSNEEAEALTLLFPPTEDECFGLAWSLVHLVESAPDWPLLRSLGNVENPWIAHLRRAAGLEMKKK